MTKQTKQTLTITRGLPASGKTTWTMQQIQRDPENTFRVERDEIRFMLFGAPFGTPEQEQAVTTVQHQAIRSLLRAGKNVIVSDTNLNPRAVKGLRRIAEQHKVGFVVKDFQVDPQVCIERDAARGAEGKRMVGAEVINGMVRRYLNETGELPRIK